MSAASTPGLFCELCKTKNATLQCGTCSLFKMLCDVCMGKRHQNHPASGHILRPLEFRPQTPAPVEEARKKARTETMAKAMGSLSPSSRTSLRPTLEAFSDADLVDMVQAQADEATAKALRKADAALAKTLRSGGSTNAKVSTLATTAQETTPPTLLLYH